MILVEKYLHMSGVCMSPSILVLTASHWLIILKRCGYSGRRGGDYGHVREMGFWKQYKQFNNQLRLFLGAYDKVWDGVIIWLHRSLTLGCIFAQQKVNVLYQVRHIYSARNSGCYVPLFLYTLLKEEISKIFCTNPILLCTNSIFTLLGIHPAFISHQQRGNNCSFII